MSQLVAEEIGFGWDGILHPLHKPDIFLLTDRSYKYPMDSQAASDYLMNITLPVSLGRPEIFVFWVGLDLLKKRY